MIWLNGTSKGNLPVTIETFFHLYIHVPKALYTLVVQSVCSYMYLLDNVQIRFGTKLDRHIIGIPIGTTCVPLVANWFLNIGTPHFEGMFYQIYPYIYAAEYG